MVNLTKDFGQLDLLMEGNKSALFVIDALVQSKFSTIVVVKDLI